MDETPNDFARMCGRLFSFVVVVVLVAKSLRAGWLKKGSIVLFNR